MEGGERLAHFYVWLRVLDSLSALTSRVANVARRGVGWLVGVWFGESAYLSLLHNNSEVSVRRLSRGRNRDCGSRTQEIEDGGRWLRWAMCDVRCGATHVSRLLAMRRV